MMSLWVRSKWSEHAERWEVYADGELGADWKVKAKLDTGRLAGCHYLPKSEYVPCEPPPPPERWEDVTGQCGAFIWTWDGDHDDTAYYLSHDGALVKENAGYSLRKVQLYTSIDGQEVAGDQWAFVVEKKVTT